MKEEILFSVLGTACFNYFGLRERAKSMVKNPKISSGNYPILEDREGSEKSCIKETYLNSYMWNIPKMI